MLSDLKGKKLILASKSPRRQELLKGLFVDFEIRTKDTDEDFPEKLKREEIALFLAKKKASAFSGEVGKDEIIITSDTIVWVNDQVLNKPENHAESIQMLQMLNGNMHTVYTGVCLTSSEKQQTFFAETKVYFNRLSDEELNFYIDRCQPFDKAGSYGVQEWMGYVGIEKIDGCFYNVMGLPLNKLYQALKSW